jgi:hypothetical protein
MTAVTSRRTGVQQLKGLRKFLLNISEYVLIFLCQLDILTLPCYGRQLQVEIAGPSHQK